MQGLFVQYILKQRKKVAARNTHQVENAMLCERCFRKSLFVSGLCGQPVSVIFFLSFFCNNRSCSRSCFVRSKSQTGRRVVGVSPTAAKGLQQGRNFITSSPEPQINKEIKVQVNKQTPIVPTSSLALKQTQC